jgi:hypothetical protein
MSARVFLYIFNRLRFSINAGVTRATAKRPLETVTRVSLMLNGAPNNVRGRSQDRRRQREGKGRQSPGFKVRPRARVEPVSMT